MGHRIRCAADKTVRRLPALRRNGPRTTRRATRVFSDGPHRRVDVSFQQRRDLRRDVSRHDRRRLAAPFCMGRFVRADAGTGHVVHTVSNRVQYSALRALYRRHAGGPRSVRHRTRTCCAMAVTPCADAFKRHIHVVGACSARSSALLIAAMKRPASLLLVGFLIVARCCLGLCGGGEHDFGKWEKEIAAYERMDRTNPPPAGALLFIGSSTIRLWKTLAQDFPSHRVINRGFGGSEIVDATHFAEQVILPYKPRMVFLRAGGNDLHAGKSPEQVFADFKEFAAKVQAKLPETQIAFISLSPSIARWQQADKEKT